MSALGILLRRRREDAQLTQEELADRAGVSARTISDIERGVRTRAYADTARRLGVALNLADRDLATFLEAARGNKRVPAATPSRPRLPRPLAPLIGRGPELRELVDALAPGESRLVTVTGLGGVGKTRLALAAAAELEDRYAGRVVVLRIAPNQEPRLLMGALAKSLGLSESASPDQVATHLAGHPTLVLLDSCEHVLAAARDIEATLAAAPELHVLATSRERLGIEGERELALMPLAVPTGSDPLWSSAPAVALFLDRARAIRPGLSFDRDPVIDICRRVSGVPLALELAAARVRHLPLAVLAARLATGTGDLADPKRPGPDRHRSMEQTLAWSIGSLTSAEGHLLEVSALFPGGWRLDAAQSLCRADLDVVGVVSGLVDKSLVFLDAEGSAAEVPRWRMLDVVREFVRGSAPRPATATRTAYVRFFLSLLAGLSANVGREQEWFEVLAAEEANVRTALMWAHADRDAETLLRLCNGMWQFWQTRGHLVEGRAWLEAGLSLGVATDETRMTSLWGAAWLAYHQADDTAAAKAAAELEALAGRSGDDRARRNASTMRGMLAISHDDPVRAVALLEDALRLARGQAQGWIVATSLLNLGLGHLSAGDTQRARAVIGEALAAYEDIGDERFRARSLGYLGHASLIEGDPERAGALFLQSLSVFRALAEPGGTAEGLAGIAATAAATGHPIRAATLAGAAEQLRRSYAGRELPLDRRTNGRYLAAAESGLGAAAWAEAWERGRDLPLRDAIDLALEQAPHLARKRV